jgi:glycosyltransferase involved in cell wall biosynthesis
MKFSIITVAYNSERFIRQTIESVLNQTYKNIEYIIIDGKSTDKTYSIITEYKEYLAIFISEPDKNMYEAINKGMKLCTGDYISILNSDDYYANNNVISDIAKQIELNKGYNGVYGNLIKVNVKGDIIRKRKGFQVNYADLLFARTLSFVGHATFFMSRHCLSTIGFYNYLNFNYACDYDFILCCFQQYKFKHIDTYIMCFRTHKNSITSSGKLTDEIFKVLEKHNYYSNRVTKRFFKYYLLWLKFMILNFKYLSNRIFIKLK